MFDLIIWWLFLVLIPFITFLWIVIHESAHSLVAKVFGHEILTFKPWPHKIGDTFYIGRMTYKTKGKDSYWILIAPYIVDCILAITSIIVLVTSRNPYFLTIMFLVYQATIINTGAAIQARYRSNFGDLAEVPNGIPKWISVFLFYWFISLIVFDGIWIGIKL